MSSKTTDFSMTISNERIFRFYKENPKMDFEKVNIWVLDLMDTIFNNLSNKPEDNINSQILSFLQMNKNEIDSMKQNMHSINENVLKINQDMTTHILSQFGQMKKDYMDDMKQIVSNTALSNNEKLNSIIEKNNSHLIDKTNLLLNDIIPKNQEHITKEIQDTIKHFSSTIIQDSIKMFHTNNTTETTLKEFILSFDTKYTQTMQSIQQPLFSFFTASEDRISKNIDVLKTNTTQSAQIQTKLSEEISDFLGKYKNSTNKGKFGENHLSNVLHSLFPNAEINDTSSQKASGDFILKRLNKPDILFENKDYNKNIPKEEIEKFIRDVDFHSMNGIFISQNTGISFKENFQIEIHKGNVLVYIHNCEYEPYKIRNAVDIIDHLKPILQNNISEQSNEMISKETLEYINTEYQYFISNKENMYSSLKDYQKNMQGLIDNSRFPELEKLLSHKYAYVKTSGIICDICNTFSAINKQSLSAHKRGCIKRHSTILTEPTNT